MHIIQTITEIHDRHLSSSFSRPSTTELYHWSQGIALFNRKLSSPVRPHDHDPLVLTAAFLSTAAFSRIAASSPEEAWPLRQSEPLDLKWLNIYHGKAIIRNMMVPSRTNSFFQALSQSTHLRTGFLDCPTSESGIWVMPPAFIRLYDLGNSSTAEKNPYHAPIEALIPLLHIESDQSNIPQFFLFANTIRNCFRDLLERKDPRALLLLSYWYATICRSLWWMTRRATLECHAICMYLERHHNGDKELMGLLQYPKVRSGLVTLPIVGHSSVSTLPSISPRYTDVSTLPHKSGALPSPGSS